MVPEGWSPCLFSLVLLADSNLFKIENIGTEVNLATGVFLINYRHTDLTNVKSETETETYSLQDLQEETRKLLIPTGRTEKIQTSRKNKALFQVAW